MIYIDIYIYFFLISFIFNYFWLHLIFIVAGGFSYSRTCEIFPDHGSTCVLCITRQILYHWTQEESPYLTNIYLIY